MAGLGQRVGVRTRVALEKAGGGDFEVGATGTLVRGRRAFCSRRRGGLSCTRRVDLAKYQHTNRHLREEFHASVRPTVCQARPR